MFLSSTIFSSSYVTISELFCGEILQTFVVLPSYNLATTSAILFLIKSPVASALF